VYINSDIGLTGTTFPIGTARTPVNNLIDAVTIAENLGIDNFKFSSDFTFGSSTYITDYNLIGEGLNETVLTFVGGSIVALCKIFNATATGDLTGVIGFTDSKISDLGSIGLFPSSQEIIVRRTLFNGYIRLPDNYSGKMTAIDCYSNVPGNNTPQLDFGNSNASLQIRNYTGGIELANVVSGNTMSIDLISGNVKLNDSVTNANITARGVGKMVSSTTGDYIPTGVWNGNVNISNDIMSKGTIAEAVGDEIGTEIEYAAFGGGVHINSGSTVTGTTYPAGTQVSPVNNLADAVSIAVERGFDELHFTSDFHFPVGTYIVGYTLIGQGAQTTTLSFDAGSVLAFCKTQDAEVTGRETGIIGFNNCLVHNLGSVGLAPSSVEVIAQNCLFKGTLTLPSNYSGILTALDCWALPDDSGNPPIVDMGNGTASVQVRNWSGLINFKNITNTVDIRVFLASGGITLDSSVTAGNYTFTGTGNLTDNSTSTDSIDSSALISQSIIAEAVSDEIGTEIEYAAYGGMVHIVSGSTVTGTTYPAGTAVDPVNNLADAVTIATGRGFDVFHFMSDFFFPNGTYISGYTLRGEGPQSTKLTFEAGSVLALCKAQDCELTGSETGIIGFNNCLITDLGSVGLVPSSVDVVAQNCLFKGTLTLPDNYSGVLTAVDCWALPDDSGNPPIVDVGNGFASIQVRNWSGLINFKNITNNVDIRVFLASGGIILDPSITSGDFLFTGTGTLTDNSTSYTSLDVKALISKDIIAEAVWDEPLADHVTAGTTGKVLSLASFDGRIWFDAIAGISGTTFPIGTRGNPSNNPIDANAIGQSQGISDYDINGLLSSGLAVSNLSLIGTTWLDDSLHLDGNLYESIIVRNLRVDGNLSADNVLFQNCYLENIDNMNAEAVACRIAGNISIQSGGTFSAVEVVVEGNDTVIDMQNNPCTVSLDINSGYVYFTNVVAGSYIDLNMKGGEIEFDPVTVTGGTFYAEGIGYLYNDPETLGMTIKGNHLISNQTIATHVWNKPLP